MKRRGFLRTSALGVGLALVGGCGAQPVLADAGAAPVPDGGVGGPDPDAGLPPDAGVDAGSGGTDGGTAIPDAGNPMGHDAGVTPQCVETEDNILGPFYRPNAPFRTQIADESDGELLFLTGSVIGHGAACVPLAGALLDVWQADADGVYDNASPNFLFRGQLNADSTGAYALQTILPGRYLNGGTYRPRHIHLRISAPGYVLLTTQLYFAGDPFIPSDPFVHPSLVVPLEQRMDGWHARFDIVLAPT